MKKLLILTSIALFSMQVHAETLLQTDFYRQQLEALKKFRPQTEISDHNHDFWPNLSATMANGKQEKVKDFPEISTIKTVKDFVSLVLIGNPEAEKQRQLTRVAQFNLSQTQALEPLLNQFSSFMTLSPTLTPLFKEHPFPGVSAIKQKIAEEISVEAEASLNNFMADLAKKARIKAYQIIQSQRKISLITQTINLYQGLKQTSESLYRNGKVSFAEFTMISIEASRLQLQKNRYLTKLKEQQENAFAMLNGKRPKLSLKNFAPADFLAGKLVPANKFEEHPKILLEKSKKKRIEDSIALVQRMAFPEYTSISSLAMKKNMSMAASSNNYRANTKIEFNRIFAEQLRSRLLAQKSAIKAMENEIKANYEADKEALRLAKQNLHIIKTLMLPELEKAFSSVKSRFESGQASFQELVETEKRLLDLREKLIDSEFETLQARASMIYDLGKIQF